MSKYNRCILERFVGVKGCEDEQLVNMAKVKLYKESSKMSDMAYFTIKGIVTAR